MSTEHSLLRVQAKDRHHPSSVDIEITLHENSDRCSLNVFKTHPRISEAFDHDKLVDGLDAAQLEQLAVRLLYVASYISPHSMDLLERYNLRFAGDDLNKPVEL